MAKTTSRARLQGVVGLYQDPQCNALMTALMRAAKDGMGSDELVYEYLLDSPKTTMIAEIVEALNDIGYSIKPNVIFTVWRD